MRPSLSRALGSRPRPRRLRTQAPEAAVPPPWQLALRALLARPAWARPPRTQPRKQPRAERKPPCRMASCFCTDSSCFRKFSSLRSC